MYSTQFTMYSTQYKQLQLELNELFFYGAYL